MRALITGVGGFAGGHLARYLCRHTDLTVFGSVFFEPERYTHLHELGLTLRRVDLRDEHAVEELLDEAAPDMIFHLAAQAFVPESWDDPWGTLENNIRAQLNILHTLARLDARPRVLVIGSADQYGAIRPDEVPVDESHPFRPDSPYSVSKIAQDMLGLQYYLSHGIPVVRVRPFNHIGPGQNKRFVAPAFASQIAAIEAGKADPVVYVGNLEARRDFTDVRDVVRAYYLALTRGRPGEVYNIGSGKAHSVRELLDLLLSLSPVAIEVRQDPARMRPVDVPVVICDAGKLRRDTGWEPAIPFEQSLRDVLAEWRAKMGVG